MPTIAQCYNWRPHEHHLWTPEPRSINGEKRCPGVTPSVSVRRMSKPPMVMRSHRFPAALYEAAKAKAEEREENISDVLREALERYVRRR